VRLRPLLEDASVLKVGHDLKPLTLLLGRHGIAVAPYDDTVLLAYALDAGKGDVALAAPAQRWLGHVALSRKDVTGSGKGAVAFEAAPLDRATHLAAGDAELALRLWLALKPRLAA